MAYQRGAILFGPRGKDSHIIVRLEGTCKRAHYGGRDELAQHAKAGDCACCTRFTNTAVPAPYPVGGGPPGRSSRTSVVDGTWLVGCQVISRACPCAALGMSSTKLGSGEPIAQNSLPHPVNGVNCTAHAKSPTISTRFPPRGECDREPGRGRAISGR